MIFYKWKKPTPSTTIYEEINRLNGAKELVGNKDKVAARYIASRRGLVASRDEVKCMADEVVKKTNDDEVDEELADCENTSLKQPTVCGKEKIIEEPTAPRDETGKEPDACESQVIATRAEVGEESANCKNGIMKATAGDGGEVQEPPLVAEKQASIPEERAIPDQAHEYQNHDKILFQIAKKSDTVFNFLDAVFGFLRRR